ncbi:hypothetical protein M0R88_08425 [Halorussus gelatinilyticus]|uniref:DUF7974 domain-containing protein n=1 Tax=Halorussus gelatinilyticus TaxID=2937524 RepID=A0A8U0ILU4_9EURY|nr:hypothetical protein [Halorussus gelatinilyticus]UPW02107.1 hypothetical protein M0R88_08425 [Halorussus gelatinilyticus]
MRQFSLSDDDGSGTGWAAGLVPESLAVRALSVTVHGPETVTVGESARFVVAVRNRLPVSVRLTHPTSRVWGWRVDDAPEADERGIEPPEATRTTVLGGGERRAFSATWDGRIRRRGRDGDEWVAYPGTVAFTGYLAVPDWRARGAYDELSVQVVADR